MAFMVRSRLAAACSMVRFGVVVVCIPRCPVPAFESVLGSDRSMVSLVFGSVSFSMPNEVPTLFVVPHCCAIWVRVWRFIPCISMSMSLFGLFSMVSLT